MIERLFFALAAPHQNLRRLVVIRFIVLAGQFAGLAYCYYGPQLAINYRLVTAIILLMVIINIVTAWRARRLWPITDIEFLCHLLIDILGFSVLLYLTGGANNPFVSYYLVPITISAALLPWRYTWITSSLSLCCYTFLLYQFVPLAEIAPSHHGAHDMMESVSGINLHILGMWFNFSVSAVLITYFVVQMAHTLRDQQESLKQAGEDQLRDEQILAVATLAAGTAHEFGTPLSTMAVLLAEMRSDYSDNAKLMSDVTVLQQQVSQCKGTLKSLVHTADRREDTMQSVELAEYLNQLVEHWQILRPEVQLEISVTSAGPPPSVDTEMRVQQAIMNLLNNAADVSAEKIELSYSWTDSHWTLLIRDFGPGVPLNVDEQIGRTFVTTKGKGLGIGLLLTHASIARLDGTVKLFNHPEEGALTELVLPLKFSSVDS